MFLELIATFVAGLGAAGVVLLINLVTRGRLPRWAMPVAAGAAMIAFTVGMEYSWGARTAGSLPEGVEVIETVEVRSWWQPWSHVWPRTTRLMAVDTTTARRNEAAPGTWLVDLYLFARWQPTRPVAQLVRCAGPARAVVTEAALADPETAAWSALDPDDALIRAICAGAS
jgi:hypothetical protein